MRTMPIFSRNPPQGTGAINNVNQNAFLALVSNPISLDEPTALVWVHWWASITAATATTSTTIKCYRGATSGGTLLDQWAGSTVPAATGRWFCSFDWHDTPGVAQAQLQYSIYVGFPGSNDTTGAVSNGGIIVMAF